MTSIQSCQTVGFYNGRALPRRQVAVVKSGGLVGKAEILKPPPIGHFIEFLRRADHLKELSPHSYVAPYNVAIVYAGLREKDQTFAWLERSFADKGYYLPVYLPTDARLDFLRSDPRWIELERRMRLPAELIN